MAEIFSTNSNIGKMGEVVGLLFGRSNLLDLMQTDTGLTVLSILIAKQICAKRAPHPWITNFAQRPCLLHIFSRGHVTLHLAVSVGPSVGPSSVHPLVGHISKLRVVFALLLLLNRP